MAAGDRPLSPHLQVYRPQWTSVLSIFHRGTGVVLSFGAVGHHFLSRSRQALVATRNGLHLVIASARRAGAVAEWPGHLGAELVLRPGEPDVTVVIDGWRGIASGLDIDALEATVRAAGGEPLRIVDRSDG